MTSPLEQKIKITGPIVVTANRVSDGTVVYRREDGDWTTQLDQAAITADAATAREMVQAAIADDLRAVGSYIAPVTLTRDGGVRPGNLRERIRLAGPTIDFPGAARDPVQTGQQAAHVSLR
ncbi:MAG TPA: DUF2849 domain-containing protein [Xanthobacteraceae bacterium]|nr:DUF2849 domain-containing protein [Xanthobacteraceae bacterium]